MVKTVKKMSWMDRLLVVVSLAATVFFSFLLLRSDRVINHFLPVEEGAKIIGFVEVANNDVRRRLKQSLLWYNVRSEETLYEKDSIFTGDNSETYIRLNGDVGFHMGANSMVVLSQENNEFKLDLQLGSVIADVHGKSGLKLVGDGEEALIKGSGDSAQVSINKTGQGRIKLASLQNAFELELDGSTRKIDAQKTLQLDPQLKEEANSKPVQLIYPPLGHTIWHDPKNEFVFRWEMLQPMSPLHLQISREFNFKTVLYEQPVATGEHRAEGVKQEGLYYWRIVHKPVVAPVSIVSDAHDFRVAIQSPPEMYIPRAEDVIKSRFSENGAPLADVQFIWEQKIGATRYQLQIGQDRNFENVLINEELPDTFKNQVILPRGEYFWRVRITAPPQGVGGWQEPRRFLISSPDEIEQIVADRDQQALEDLQMGQSAPGLPAFHKPDVAQLGENTTEQNIPLRSPQPTESKSTTLLRFKENINSRDPAAVQKAILNPPQFKWDMVKGASGYDIEISKDRSFEEPILRRRLKDPEFVWAEPQVGQYFWRVRSMRGDEEVSLFSPENLLNVGIESPVLPKEIVRSFEAASPQDFITAGPPIEVQWKNVPMAEAYKVVIMTEDNQQRVYDKIVKEPKIEVEFAKAGRYLASVAALNKDEQRISPFSTPSVISFEKTFKFGTPQVLYPINGTTVVTFGSGRPDSMILDWNRVEGAKSYRLQFSQDKNFTKIFFDKAVPVDQYFVNDIVPEGTIYWRVRAEYDSLFSRWTTPRYFEIQAVKGQAQ